MKLINCDLGECLTPNPDEAIMPLIGMASIACGGHIGNEDSMVVAVNLAKNNGVRIGAHPSYLDQENFGRTSHFHSMSSSALFQLIYKQVTEFITLCEQQGVELEYIKPHGALYHDMMHDPEVLDILCDVIQQVKPTLSLVVQAEMNMALFEEVSKDKNIQFLYEVFADRGYRRHQLIPRNEEGAMLDNVQDIVAQYQYFSNDQLTNIDTICFHSDNPASVEALKILKHV